VTGAAPLRQPGKVFPTSGTNGGEGNKRHRTGRRFLMAWLHDPPAIEPGTVMPKLGLNEQEVRDIAALLSTLR
jgi:cytochrome c1